MKTAITALGIMGVAATLTVVSAQPGQPSRAGMLRYDNSRAGNSANYSARYNTNRNMGNGRYFDDMFNERRRQNYYQAPYQGPYQSSGTDRGYYNLYNNPAVGTTYRY